MDDSKSNVDIEGAGTRDRLAIKRGPRTPEGKTRVKRNAVRHGIFASLLFSDALFQESEPDFRKLRKALFKDFRPAEGIEEALVDTLAITLLQLSRVYKIELRLAPQIFACLERSLSDSGPAVITEEVDREREIVIVRRTPQPELLIRYRESLAKQVHRTVEQLNNLQRIRREREDDRD